MSDVKSSPVLVQNGDTVMEVTTDMVADITDPTILSALAKEKALVMQIEVASNPNTPAEALTALAIEPNSRVWVKETVASNPNTPFETLEELFNKGWSSVREAVCANPSMPAEWVNEKAYTFSSVAVLTGVAKSIHATEETLNTLLKTNDISVVSAAVLNPTASMETIHKLATGEIESNVAEVAQNCILNERYDDFVAYMGEQLNQDFTQMPKAWIVKTFELKDPYERS